MLLFHSYVKVETETPTKYNQRIELFAIKMSADDRSSKSLGSNIIQSGAEDDMIIKVEPVGKTLVF